MKERSWLATSFQMLSTVAVISLAAGRTAAGRAGLNGFDGRGNNVVGGVPASCPRADKLFAYVFRLDADLLKARIAQDLLQFIHARSASNATAEGGEIGADFRRQLGG